MGSAYSLLNQSIPPASKWNVEQIPDLSGKVMIVTGGNAGIGYETIKALLAHNAKVYIASRSRDKAEQAIKDLEKATGKLAVFLELDLADLASVRKSANEFLSKETELHVLFNNGGVMAPDIRLMTKDGYDLQFGTNVIGHFYFTQLVIPALLAGAKSSPDKKARVVTTSSSANYFGDLNFDAFIDSPARKKMGTNLLYCQSKFGNVVVARELARRYGDQGIVSTSLNPGNIKTELQRHLPGLFRRIMNAFLYSMPYGAITQLYAGTAPEAVDLNGAFLIPWARVGKANAKSGDPELGLKLWAWLEAQVEGK